MGLAKTRAAIGKGVALRRCARRAVVRVGSSGSAFSGAGREKVMGSGFALLNRFYMREPRPTTSRHRNRQGPSANRLTLQLPVSHRLWEMLYTILFAVTRDTKL